MDRKKLLKHLVFLMFFIFIANTLAQKFYWYYSIWYFDMVMHFLGGLWEGLFFIWFFSMKDPHLPKWFLRFLDLDTFELVYKTLLFVLAVGVLWEFFEFFTNNYIGHDPFNVLDTISDIFFDLSGGAFAVLYFLKRIVLVKENKVELN